MTKKFEYSIVPIISINKTSSNITEKDEIILNQAGRNGWEIAGITGTVIIFKRPLTRKREKLLWPKKKKKR